MQLTILCTCFWWRNW